MFDLLWKLGKKIAFADDTVRLCSGENYESTIKAAKSGINNIAKWLRLNSLSLNTTQTVFVTFPNIVTQDLKIQYGKSKSHINPSQI